MQQANAVQTDNLVTKLVTDVVRAHTSAPLRMQGSFILNISPDELFPRVTDPALIAGWFGMVSGGKFDHSSSEIPGRAGSGTRRLCHTRGMGDLHETMLYWDAPRACVYNVRNFMMPVRDHAALMVIEPNGLGAKLSWLQFYEFKGIVMRHVFPSMMLSMMNAGMRKLAEDVGGPGGEMFAV